MDSGSRTFSFGQFRLDCERGELRRAGQLVDLAPKPLSLLLYLALHRTRAVPKHELLDQLWPDVFVSETALSSALKDLRRAIGDDGARMEVIQTLRRRGYRFAAQVREGRLAPKPPSVVESFAESDAPQPPLFVGRERELTWLGERLALAASGRPRVAIVVGEAGIGKSRLLEQFERDPACADFEFVTGRCHMEASVPYLPFVEALSEWLLQNDETSDHVLGEDAAVVHRLLHPDSAAAGLVRGMENPVGERERAELFASVYRVFEQLARRRQTVLVLEDLHRADLASLDLLAHLIGAISDAWNAGPLPLLVIATLQSPKSGTRLARELVRLSGESVCDRLDVDGLDAGSVTSLIESLGIARSPASALREIAETTRGNPLFVAEVLREGGTTLPRNRAKSSPDALDAALAARIARLRESTRGVLTVAAFIGDRFGLLALAAACRMTSEAILAAISDAVQAGLLAGERRSFRFAHPLVREVLIDSTSDVRRGEIHRDLADVLEELYASARGEHALEIAHHLALAGSDIAPERLFKYARRAADQAFGVFAWHDAARFYETATRVSGELPAAERAALHFRGGLAASHDGDSRACLRHYTKAADLFAQIGDDAGHARVLMLRVRAQRALSGASSGAALDVGALEALAQKLAEPQPALHALILESLSQAHWASGDAALAESYARRALAIGQQINDDAVCRSASMGLGLARFSLLQVREAIESWREVLERAQRSRDPWLASTASARIPLGLIHLGRLDEAHEAASEAERLARHAANAMDLSLILSQKACIDVARGHLGSSKSSALAASLAIQRASDPWAGALLVGARACAAALRGAWQEAESTLVELAARDTSADQPAPHAELLVEAYRALIEAQRMPANVDVKKLDRLFRRVRNTGSEIDGLAPLCAIAETAERVAARELSAECSPLLRRAHERGVVLTAGWVQSIPRLLAGCARTAGHVDEAERWYARAIESARGARVPAELAVALVSRARLRAQRGGPDDHPRARADLAEALPITVDLALAPLAVEAERLSAVLRT